MPDVRELFGLVRKQTTKLANAHDLATAVTPTHEFRFPGPCQLFLLASALARIGHIATCNNRCGSTIHAHPHRSRTYSCCSGLGCKITSTCDGSDEIVTRGVSGSRLGVPGVFGADRCIFMASDLPPPSSALVAVATYRSASAATYPPLPLTPAPWASHFGAHESTHQFASY